MSKNELRRKFISTPFRDDLAEQLIKNKAQAGGDCARMLNELIEEADPEPPDDTNGGATTISCSVCGKSIEEPADLVVLCEQCHEKHHEIAAKGLKP